jgi:hypothetical protein
MTESDMLCAWERGEGRLPVERALVLLACGFRERSQEELWALPIGTRDSLLFALREQTFGSSLRGYAMCPECATRLRFTSDTRALRTPERVSAPDRAPWVLVSGEWELGFRLPDSRDLAEVAAASRGDEDSARDALLLRCITSARRGGALVPPGELRRDLPDEVAEELIAALAARDPQAEVLLSLSCPSCAHAFVTAFDIGSFLFSEVAAQARLLLGAVDALARAYGWSEHEILGLSALRRRHYLRLVGHE